MVDRTMTTEAGNAGPCITPGKVMVHFRVDVAMNPPFSLFCPRRLISLADMIEHYLARDLVFISDCIQSAGVLSSNTSDFSEADKKQLQGWFNGISQESGRLAARKIYLPMSAATFHENLTGLCF